MRSHTAIKQDAPADTKELIEEKISEIPFYSAHANEYANDDYEHISENENTSEEGESEKENENYSVAAIEARLEKIKLRDLEHIPPVVNSDMTPLNSVREQYDIPNPIDNLPLEQKEDEEKIALSSKKVFIDPTDEIKKLYTQLDLIGKTIRWLSLQSIPYVTAKMDGEQLENRLNKIKEIKITLNMLNNEKLKHGLSMTIDNLDNHNNLNQFDPEYYPKNKMTERLEKCRQVLKKINDEEIKLNSLEAKTQSLLVKRETSLNKFYSMTLEQDELHLANGNYELVCHQAFNKILKFITGNNSCYFQKLRQHAKDNPKKREQIEYYLAKIEAATNLEELFITLNADPKLSASSPSMREYVPTNNSWLVINEKCTANEYAKSLEKDLIDFIKRTYPEITLNKALLAGKLSAFQPRNN